MLWQSHYLTTHVVHSIQTAKLHIAQSNTLVTKDFSDFSHIWAAPLFPLIWISPKNSSLTSWESMSMYLQKSLTQPYQKYQLFHLPTY